MTLIARDKAVEEAQPTLMELYRRLGSAEWRLEQAVVDAFGGIEACWFQNWYFDTYDSSVELTESENGREPTVEQLQALAAAGIRIVFVSYLDGTARSWRKHHGWAKGECSPRTTDEDKRGAWQRAQEAERESDGWVDAAAAEIASDPGTFGRVSEARASIAAILRRYVRNRSAASASEEPKP